jgi:hypothetical protein
MRACRIRGDSGAMAEPDDLVAYERVVRTLSERHALPQRIHICAAGAVMSGITEAAAVCRHDCSSHEILLTLLVAAMRTAQSCVRDGVRCNALTKLCARQLYELAPPVTGLGGFLPTRFRANTVKSSFDRRTAVHGVSSS